MNLQSLPDSPTGRKLQAQVTIVSELKAMIDRVKSDVSEEFHKALRIQTALVVKNLGFKDDAAAIHPSGDTPATTQAPTAQALDNTADTKKAEGTKPQEQSAPKTSPVAPATKPVQAKK